MIYTILFCGTIVCGAIFYYQLVRFMESAKLIKVPSIPFFFLFVGYGCIILLIISEYFKIWSAMHTFAALGLFVVGMPWLLVQGFLWRGTWSVSVYHRIMIISSFASPIALAMLVAYAFLTER